MNSKIKEPLLVALILINFQAQANQKKCPSNSENGLITFLENHKTQQGSFVHFPISYTSVEQIGINFIDKTIFAKNLLEIPYFVNTRRFLILDKYQQKKYELIKELLVKSDGFELKLYKPGADYVIIHQFEKTRNCWQLRSIDNRSL